MAQQRLKGLKPNPERIRELLFPHVMALDTDGLSDTRSESEKADAIARAEEVEKTLNFLILLLERLEEKNTCLFERIVCCCGISLCQDVLKETSQLLQQQGAIATQDGERLRSKGGTFIVLLKKRLSKEQVNFIWKEQKQRQAQYKRDKKATSSKLDVLIEKTVRGTQKRPREPWSLPTPSTGGLPCTAVEEIEDGELYVGKQPKTAKHPRSQ